MIKVGEVNIVIEVERSDGCDVLPLAMFFTCGPMKPFWKASMPLDFLQHTFIPKKLVKNQTAILGSKKGKNGQKHIFYFFL